MKHICVAPPTKIISPIFLTKLRLEAPLPVYFSCTTFIRSLYRNFGYTFGSQNAPPGDELVGALTTGWQSDSSFRALQAPRHCHWSLKMFFQMVVFDFSCFISKSYFYSCTSTFECEPWAFFFSFSRVRAPRNKHVVGRTHTVVRFQTRIRRKHGTENSGVSYMCWMDFHNAILCCGFLCARLISVYYVSILCLFCLFSLFRLPRRGLPRPIYTARAITPLPPLHGYHACLFPGYHGIVLCSIPG